MTDRDFAKQRVRDAFTAIVEARQILPLDEFEAFIRTNLDALGGRGFVASTGALISHAAKREGKP